MSGRAAFGVRAGGPAMWWWFLVLGVVWIWFDMFVLSPRVGSLAAVAAFVGVVVLFACAAAVGCDRRR
jgi:uncharacterized membrane protein HdeD (DUF308 family)